MLAESASTIEGINCTLALLPLCTGLTPPLTSTSTHLQSRHRLPGTIYLLPSVILPPWLPSKLHLKHISSTLLTRHTSDCHPSAPFCDIWRQLKKFMLIDWLIDTSTIYRHPVGQAIIFYRCGFFFVLFFLTYSQRSEIGCLPFTWCVLARFKMHVWSVLHVAHWKYRMQKLLKKIAICAPLHNVVGLYLCK